MIPSSSPGKMGGETSQRKQSPGSLDSSASCPHPPPLPPPPPALPHNHLTIYLLIYALHMFSCSPCYWAGAEDVSASEKTSEARCLA